MRAIKAILFKPITIAPLIYFRVVFGLIMLWEVYRYFFYDRVSGYFIEPTYMFHYRGFEWITPLSGDGMNWLFVGLGLLALMIVLGLFYRVSIFLFWLLFTYVFLLDQTQYLNHFYLVSLISFLMIFVSAHHAWSFDALIRPSIRLQTVPNWSLWLLRSQMAIVYIYGGVAKINPDWLHGEPMREWLAERTHFPLVGHLFTQEWVVYFFSYGGLLFDLLIVPFILWKRTRVPALIVAFGFHLTNHHLFNIGIFPFLAMGTTLLFLPPDWFRLQFHTHTGSSFKSDLLMSGLQKIGIIGFAVYFGVQILLPLRHFLYSGYVSWTEEGHTLAWHMKLRSKDGYAWLFASDPVSGSTWRIDLDAYLNDRQISQMKDNPHMILRFSHHLGDLLETEYEHHIEVKVWSMMSLNSRSPQLLIDPTVDLTEVADDFAPADWILPLVQPPAPHQGNPAILISEPKDGVMIWLNFTSLDFPLKDFLAQINLEGGTEVLEPSACMLTYAELTALQSFFPICNEASRLNNTLTLSDIQQLRIDGYEQYCRDESCVFIAQS